MGGFLLWGRLTDAAPRVRHAFAVSITHYPGWWSIVAERTAEGAAARALPALPQPISKLDIQRQTHVATPKRGDEAKRIRRSALRGVHVAGGTARHRGDPAPGFGILASMARVRRARDPDQRRLHGPGQLGHRSGRSEER